ncbi:hypothetical protein SAMN05216570_3024 [Dyella sp. OK004]|uniref:hypothetical protein n=1 Tax=Dyella sp. OK004 TaxID=1855292 RepID=UPI0008F410EE|nr:hypothetical protein [Dyella sp. OK004]SFS14144.1 hypothetical protein SAMN05216570_3024 [Dyella sp. OK004]
MLKGNLKVAVPMPPPPGENDTAAWDVPDTTPCGVEIAGSEFQPVPGQPNVYIAAAPEKFKLTVTATVLSNGSIGLAYSRYVDETENNLAV